MLLSFLFGVFTVVLVYLVVWMLRQITSYVYANGEESIVGIGLLVLMLAMFASCSKDDIPQVCYDGSCDATLELPGNIDSNGYYHIDLEWNGEYFPRFSIDIYADATDPYWWYNETPVAQANFYTDTTIDVGYDIIPVVQSSRINLSSRDKSNTLYGKRIVGPFPPEMKGDTIDVKAVIFWDAGINYKEKEISIKFIVE